MSNIPAAREELIEIADMLAKAARRIRKIVANDLTRESPISRAKPTAIKVTPAIAKNIRKLALAFPDLPHREIARKVGVDGGRVSEVLNDKR